jgi:hypothetical protein
MQCLPLFTLLLALGNPRQTILQPWRREGERGNSENVSDLSAGAYNTTWLVMVTLSQPVQARFLGMKTKILFLCYGIISTV